MKKVPVCLIGVSLIAMLFSCNSPNQSDRQQATADSVSTADTLRMEDGQTVSLPEPYATKSAKNFSNVIGWPVDKTPTAPAGFAACCNSSLLMARCKNAIWSAWPAIRHMTRLFPMLPFP